MTPTFIGLMATTFPGVRPSMSLASLPTATTSPVFLLIATMEGSLTTIPLPLENTSVLAVPRSIAKSEENRLKTERKLYPFFLIMTLSSGRRSLVPPAPQSPDRKSWSGRFASQITPLWNYNRHRFSGCAPPPVLPGDHNRIAPPAEGLREVSEMAVGPDIGHLLPVNQQGCAGFGAANHLDDIAV